MRREQDRRKTWVTYSKIGDLLPNLLQKISKRVEGGEREILEAWPEIVGEKIAAMARAVRYRSGTLEVDVENSALYSLFVEYEKERLIALLKGRFPEKGIEEIRFRIGGQMGRGMRRA